MPGSVVLYAEIDWERMFVPSTPLVEIFVRGSLTYLGILALLRSVLQRQSGAVGIADLLLVVLIADAAQNGMAGDYRSITDGILLVAVIVFWNYALDWLGFYIPLMQRFVRPPPLQLVKNGQLLRRNMRRELITEDELMSEVRMQGGESIDQVQFAHMEGDGRISVILKDHAAHHESRRRRAL